jgi:SagB-type dehydrogenase family enzyme
MKRRELLAGLAVGAIVESTACHSQESPARFANEIALPKPTVAGTVSLEEAIERRRSVRSYKPTPLPVANVGQLFWSGQGITNAIGRRAAPSAGALYALELYAVTATEVMHYVPQGHKAQTRTTPDLRPQLRAVSLDQAVITSAPVVIVVAAEPARLSQRYGAKAEAFAEIEAGHAAQNIMLQAVALGLGSVPVGSLDGAGAARALALPSGQTVVYLLPVGFAA